MLDLAFKYETQLQSLFANIAFDDKYKFLYSASYRDKYVAKDTTWNTHEFVSLHNGEVIGYLKYNIDRDSLAAHSLQIVNFNDVNLIFSKDLKQFLENIFMKFKFRKLKFGCFIGNPIEKSYDKMVEKYGGRIVGVYHKDDKLIDGEYYDYKMYEIHRGDVINKLKK